MDHALVQAMIDEMLPGMAGPRTSLGDAIGLGIKMFDQSKAPQKVLVVLTDGNDTASKMPPSRAADIAKDRKVTVHTVGIGDPGSDRRGEGGSRRAARRSQRHRRAFLLCR